MLVSTLLILRCHRTREKLRSGELEVPGDQWPVFLYSGNVYDVEDPWKGLLRSSLLVSVGRPLPFLSRLN